MLDQDGKALHLRDVLAWELPVVEAASQIGVAVFEESDMPNFGSWVDLDIGQRERVIVLCDLELSKVLLNEDTQSCTEIGCELLQAIAFRWMQFNDKISKCKIFIQ